MELSRHTIRKKAVQALFSMEFNQSMTQTEAIDFVLTYNKKDENDESVIPHDEYLVFLVEGVCDNKEKIDQLVERHLKNWTIQRLPRLDLTIMRVAIYEMLTSDDMPLAVAINEAIQLAKIFSDDKSRRFINAVLANIKNELTEAE